MHPIKPKQLLQQTAEETGYSLPVVTAIVNFFYSELSQAMGSCRDINFSAPGLGTFTMKKTRAVKKLAEMQTKLEKAQERVSEKPESIARKNILKDRLLRVSELEKALLLLEDQEKKRLDIKEKRNQSPITQVL